ncbi:MAG: histidine kinase [Spirochaetota bacterium]
MATRIRIAIRTKLLLFYTAAILAVVLLDLSVQVASYGAIQEFQGSLARYHSIHRLRLNLASHFSNKERLLREDPFNELADMEAEMAGFLFVVSSMELIEPESLNAFFNLQATRRGIVAYFDRLEHASANRQASQADWYLELAAAGRISAYMDGYLSMLLSEAMDYGEARYQNLVGRLTTLRSMTIGGLVVFALLFGLAAAAFSSSVAGPIHRLALASERIAAGELDVPEIQASTGDEVEILAHSFNTMSRSIRSMVDDLRGKAELERRLREEERELMEKERALREAQFISLQDQIQPHFLFNALNTIARTALFENATKTEELSLALGRLFRYALSAPESMVPVKDELSIVEEYLAFQSLRFGDRLRWTIKSQPSSQSIQIPRFTIQPFVENAVRHGIEPREEGGSVEIEVRRKGNRLSVAIRDTGVGMDIPAIGRASEGDDHRIEGIGINNVRRRLELRYGKEARLVLKSRKGTGTEVHIFLPVAQASRDQPLAPGSRDQPLVPGSMDQPLVPGPMDQP